MYSICNCKICVDMQTFLWPFKQNCLPRMKIVSDQVGDDDAVLDSVVKSLHVRVIYESVIPVPEHARQRVSCNKKQWSSRRIRRREKPFLALKGYVTSVELWSAYFLFYSLLIIKGISLFCSDQLVCKTSILCLNQFSCHLLLNSPSCS